MKIVYEVIIRDIGWGEQREALTAAIAKLPGVISIAEMEYDGLGGYDAVEETRTPGPEFGR